MNDPRCLGLLLIGLLLLPTAPLHAEEPNAGSAEADRHFALGVELMKADNCSQAVPEFLTSQRIEPSAGTLINLATCYARLGRSGTAWKIYRTAAELASSERADALRERAIQGMTLLGPALTKLRIVTGSTRPLSIRVNGEEIPNYDGLPIPLDPGENVIEAGSPGHEPWRKSVTTSDLGATIVIEVPELRPLTSAPAPSKPARPAYLLETQPAATPVDLRLPAALLAGAGVASVIVGTAFGLSAKSTYDESQAHCQANRCTQPGIDLRDQADEKATVSTVTLSVGLVAVAASVALWLASPHARPKQAATTANGISVDGWHAQRQVARDR